MRGSMEVRYNVYIIGVAPSVGGAAKLETVILRFEVFKLKREDTVGKALYTPLDSVTVETFKYSVSMLIQFIFHCCRFVSFNRPKNK